MSAILPSGTLNQDACHLLECDTHMNTSGNKGAGVKQIASALNLSIGTVDRTLHNRSGVNAATRASVLAMAEPCGSQSQAQPACSYRCLFAKADRFVLRPLASRREVIRDSRAWGQR